MPKVKSRAKYKAPREGSKRALLLRELKKSKGLSEVQIQNRFGWNRKDAQDALRLLRDVNRVRVSQDEQGRFHASVPAGASAA